MSITRQLFGTTYDDIPIELYTLINKNGLEARIMTYGGTLVSLKSRDARGIIDDVVLGFDELQGYLTDSPYFGSLIGRHANRIARGEFRLDGETYRLACNNGPNHLHGGVRGFDKVVWKAEMFSTAEDSRLRLSYLSPDGEEGYPGNLNVEVTYALTDNDELRLDYRATTDRPTIVNLTNHTYFNLAGKGAVLEHLVQLAADRFLPIDDTFIPTGERRFVAGTAMDFIEPCSIGSHLNEDDEQLHIAGGYDHCWILGDKVQDRRLAAEVFEPKSGRVLRMYTTEPGLQFYTGNFLDGSIRGKAGVRYAKHTGFCLEAQHFPNTPNRSDFPSTVLRPGQIYQQTTLYWLGIKSASV